MNLIYMFQQPFAFLAVPMVAAALLLTLALVLLVGEEAIATPISVQCSLAKTMAPVLESTFATVQLAGETTVVKPVCLKFSTWSFETFLSSTAVCSSACQNSGTCIAPDTCSCTSSWTGPTCATPVCNPPCKNGGTCVAAPDICTCTSDWQGDSCAFRNLLSDLFHSFYQLCFSSKMHHPLSYRQTMHLSKHLFNQRREN